MRVLNGHAANVCLHVCHRSVEHLDWSSDGRRLRSSCGAHEQLYWNVFPNLDLEDVQEEGSVSKQAGDEWDSYTCMYGAELVGIWPPYCDGTVCARLNALRVTKLFGVSMNEFRVAQVRSGATPCPLAVLAVQ